MSDEKQPDERTESAPPAETGLPAAGRKPEAPAPPEDAEPTVQLKRPVAGEEPTRRLTPIRPELDGETRRLSAPEKPAEPSPVPVKTEEPVEKEEQEEKAEPPKDEEKKKKPAGKEVVRVTPEEEPKAADPWRRLSSAGALIWVLLALFGFTLVVQLRSNNTDEGLTSARQEDLVRILSDLEARDTRLQAEITALENSQRRLTSGVAGRQAALAEAETRAQELGLLAGTLKGSGPGLEIRIDRVKASAILNAVQELRGAGGEVMQLASGNGNAVRIVASTYFVDAEGGGIVADGIRLTGPYTLSVIGQPQTMETALQIPGGVVASVKSDGGSVTMEQRQVVDVTATREAGSLQYARPAS